MEESFARNGKLSRVANRRKISGNFSITLHLLYCTFKQLSATEYSKSDRKNLLDFYYFLPVGNWLRKLLGSDLYLALGFVSCQMAIQWSIHSNLSHLLLFRESPILSLALALSTGCPTVQASVEWSNVSKMSPYSTSPNFCELWNIAGHSILNLLRHPVPLVTGQFHRLDWVQSGTILQKNSCFYLLHFFIVQTFRRTE